MTSPSDTAAPMAGKWAVEALGQYYVARADESEAKKRKDAAGIVLRAYLAKSGEPLSYEGLTAAIVTRETGGDFDWAHMPDSAILLLARAGGLKAESAAAIAQIAKKDPELGDLIKRWKMPGGQTETLEVRNK